MEQAQFNTEILWSNGGDIEEIKRYCTNHVCTGEDYFRSGLDVCPSNRDGKCMMREYYMRKDGMNDG